MSQFYDQDNVPVPPAPAAPEPPRKAQTGKLQRNLAVATLIFISVAAIVSVSNAINAKERLDEIRESAPTPSTFTQTGSPVPAFTDEELGIDGVDEPEIGSALSGSVDPCIDFRSGDASKRAVDASELGQRLFKAYNFDGAARQFGIMGQQYTKMSRWVEGDSVLTGYLAKAGDGYQDASISLFGSDFKGTLAGMRIGVRYVNKSTARMKSNDVEIC